MNNSNVKRAVYSESPFGTALDNFSFHNLMMVTMPDQIPAKSLIRLNWMVSIMASIVIFAFLITLTEDLSKAINSAFQAFLFFILAGFINLLLLRVFQKERGGSESYANRKFYALSYSASLIVGILTRILYPAFTGMPIEVERFDDLEDHLPSLLSVFTLNTLILVLQNLVIIQQKKIKSEIENLQLKAAASETNNLLLRQQIHPHFLFNSLNAIKSLYKIDPRQGEDYLVHLANFLRVTISNQATSTALIKNELDFCLDYLAMQKIRFGIALNYSIQIDEQIIRTQYIPYFSLQPLVENVIKHNDLTEDRPIEIRIQEIEGYLCISNNFQPRKYKEPSTGHGLSNLSERYRLLVGEDIHIERDDFFFAVRIKILER